MRLTGSRGTELRTRRRLSPFLFPWLLAAWVAVMPLARADGPERGPDPEDILGELVVEAGAAGPVRLVLPVLAVEAPLQETRLEARMREILTRDLELSGELEVVPVAKAAVRPESSQAAVDLEPWRVAGVQVVIRTRAELVRGGQVELRAEIHRTGASEGRMIVRTVAGPVGALRLTTHRLADAVVGALTGYEGPFASRLAFVRTAGGKRTVYALDPDGYGLTAASPANHVAVAPAFDREGVLYWAASIDRGRYRLHREGRSEPIDLEPAGSVYGLAFDDTGARVALSVAMGPGVQVFVGASDFTGLERVTDMLLAMHPAFSPRGALAYAGTARRLQRIYVDGRPVSPRGLPGSAPVFCRHPDGTKLIFSVGVRARADLLATDSRGRNAVRLTRGQGRNSHPACSPDGRLVAFFSTRRNGEGSGLYLMRVDGRRPRKILDIVGDSLQWSHRVATPGSTTNAGGKP
jgi:TolB protein